MPSKLRRLTTAKGLTPAELDIINQNFHYIEEALNSVGAATPGGGPAIPGITDHGALTGLLDDDHSQYLLLAGRTGGQTITSVDQATIVRRLYSGSESGSILALIAEGTSTGSIFGLSINADLFTGILSAGDYALNIIGQSGDTKAYIDWGGALGGFSVFLGNFPGPLVSTLMEVGGITQTDVVGSSGYRIRGNSSIILDVRSRQDLDLTINTGAPYVMINSSHLMPNGVLFTIDGSAGHTADLQQWRDSTTAILSRIASDGTFHGPLGSGVTITESQIIDGTILARVAADEDITGDWEFSGVPIFSGSDGVGRSTIFNSLTSGSFPVFRTDTSNSWYFGIIEDDDNPGLNYLVLALDGQPNGVGTPLLFPGQGGTVVSTSAIQSLTGKTLSATCTIVVGTASNVFQQSFAPTKKAYLTLANITAGSTRAYGGLDFDGNLVLGLPGVDRTTTVGTTTLMTNTAVSARLVSVLVYAETTAAGSGTLEVTIGWTSNGNAKTETVFATYDNGQLQLNTLNAHKKASIVVFSDVSTTVTYAVTKTGGGTGETFRVIIAPKVL
jgi:hypothetical protein